MENSELKSEIKKYNCPFCLKKFNRLSSLKIHIKKVHLLYGIYCPFCIEFYGTIAKLESHLAMTNDEFHRNLYYLISRKHTKKVDKKLLIDKEK
jgi:uncharacterized Zn-finger protein